MPSLHPASEPYAPRGSRRAVSVRSIRIGGGAPISVQSMVNTDPTDVAATVEQIDRLVGGGCEIVRIAVPHQRAADALREIRRRVDAPLVADIHYDHRLALAALEAGVDKLRLNPGNIQDPEHIARVADAAGAVGVPIRVGANSGSLAPGFLDGHGRATAKGLVSSAMEEIATLERRGFTQIVVSLKGTDVPMTIEANRQIARQIDYPLHIGITEAGTAWEGAIRSAVGLGVLLAEGIGDTMRVSLAGDPLIEVRAAYAILRSLGLRSRGITWRVCPTCGRTRIDLAALAERLQTGLADLMDPLTVALMGCSVNGLGEVREADVGVVGGEGRGAVYVGGAPVHHAVPEAELPAIVEATVRFVAAERRRDGEV
jgi:(E)-4-hydroxy-3-methylbut-2-enyl-diphosphate synthase